MIVYTHLGKALSSLNRGERQTAIDMSTNRVTPSGGKIAESVPDLAKRTGRSEDQVGSATEPASSPAHRDNPAAPGQDPWWYRRYEIFHDVLAPSINRAIAEREERRRANPIRRLLETLTGGEPHFGIESVDRLTMPTGMNGELSVKRPESARFAFMTPGTRPQPGCLLRVLTSAL